MTEISEGISLLKILNGFLFRLPELSGAWDFTVTYEQTRHSPFQGLQVTYRALLTQERGKFSGTGEKIFECGPTQPSIEYFGADRVHIRIEEGIVVRKASPYRPAEVHMRYMEEGDERRSSTFLRLICCKDVMFGSFESTIADTRGAITWRRRKEFK